MIHMIAITHNTCTCTGIPVYPFAVYCRLFNAAEP